MAAEEVESCIIMNEEPVDVKREDIITKSKKKKKIEKKREREREKEDIQGQKCLVYYVVANRKKA